MNAIFTAGVPEYKYALSLFVLADYQFRSSYTDTIDYGTLLNRVLRLAEFFEIGGRARRISVRRHGVLS